MKRFSKVANTAKVLKAFKHYRKIKQYDPTPNKRTAKMNVSNKFMLTMNEMSALSRMINC